MIATRCQICGRRKHLRKNGTLVYHHVGGPRCPGSGHPPIEVDDAWLVEYAAQLDAAYRQARDAIKALEDRRVNYIDPALIVRRGILAGDSLKIRRRLIRHHEWPARYIRTYDRHMMTQGYVWAGKPPAYLISRYVAKEGWTPPAFR